MWIQQWSSVENRTKETYKHYLVIHRQKIVTIRSTLCAVLHQPIQSMKLNLPTLKIHITTLNSVLWIVVTKNHSCSNNLRKSNSISPSLSGSEKMSKSKGFLSYGDAWVVKLWIWRFAQFCQSWACLHQKKHKTSARHCIPYTLSQLSISFNRSRSCSTRIRHSHDRSSLGFGIRVYGLWKNPSSFSISKTRDVQSITVTAPILQNSVFLIDFDLYQLHWALVGF